MALTDKMKQIGEEIKKTVDESGIKDTAISAGMIITDKAKKSKENIESKIEENKNKLQLERQHIEDVQKSIYESIVQNQNLFDKLLLEDIMENRLISYTETFGDKIYKLYKDDLKKDMYFSSNIPTRIEEKIKNLYEIDSSTSNESILMCYYGGVKDNFVLTTKKFYFTMKHFSECIIYSLDVDNNKISLMSVDPLTNEFKINNVAVFKVDKYTGEIINKYINKLMSNNLNFTEDEISNEIENALIIKEIFDKNYLLKIKQSFEQEEKFKYLSFSSKNHDIIVCTSNRLIVQDVKSDGLQIINDIKYRKIDFIDIEDENDIVVMLNIFSRVSLEVIFEGTKIKIKDIDINDAKKIIEIVNESREKIKVSSKKSNEDDIFIKIEKLSRLKEIGAITESEFETKKKELLDRI